MILWSTGDARSTSWRAEQRVDGTGAPRVCERAVRRRLGFSASADVGRCDYL
jgi:hypothetical protein